MEIFKTACSSVLRVKVGVSCFATWYVVSGGLGSNSQRVLHEPDSRAPSVRHFSKDLVSVAEEVANTDGEPHFAVKTREGLLADQAGLLTLNGAFMCKAFLDLRQSRCQLHGHLIVVLGSRDTMRRRFECSGKVRQAATVAISWTKLAGAVGVLVRGAS